ncbi:hypothetical protein BTR22_06760 [Alkalihalophilus pseudofirmus]|uniref:hypothetical protein n=1 Tax=Alkalihalophilus pseudofirmus TaxID=79885 RepID=UPI000952C36D|nr:hypothetical protein BTR22_06760 [Alkalihalophilus pseudofirmus]
MKLKSIFVTSMVSIMLAGCMQAGESPEDALPAQPDSVLSQAALNEETMAIAYSANDSISVSTVQKQGGSWFVLEDLKLGEASLDNIDTVKEGQFIIAGFSEQNDNTSVDQVPLTIGDAGEVNVWFLDKKSRTN